MIGKSVTWLARAGALALLALGSVAAMAETVFAPHSAEYDVRISVLGGKLSTRLATTEQGYAAHHVIRPTGMSRMVTRGKIDEYSEFRVTGDAIVPDTYRSHDQITSDKVKADLTFDWDTFTAEGVVNDQEFLFEMGEFAHDRVSIQYQLMRDLKYDATSNSYQLFDIDEMKTLNIKMIGEKQVKVDAGTFDAIGIQHQRVGSSRVTTLWCVAELDFLPVVIEQHRKGKLRMRATLDKYIPRDS